MDCSSHENHYNQYNENENENWLGFSLSNNNNYNNIHLPSSSSSSPHHLSLFQPPFHHHLSQSGGDESHELSISSPKLEDFLGEIDSGAPFGCGNQATDNTSSDTTGNLYDDDINNNNIISASESGKEPVVAKKSKSPPAKKSIETFGQRTSVYRGVTRHRWTGRYEAHLWDNSCRREGQSRKGRQVYLGGYDKEERAARAYDLAALKYWGPNTTTNFQVNNYEKEMEDMKIMNRQEFVASLRRKSSGFSRGTSIYRGVTRHHQHGRWQARIGRVAGNKDLYLGTFSTQEEAAEAYDIAAIKFRGINAVTNFDMNRYDIDSIAISTIPVGPTATTKTKASSSTTSKKNKDGSSGDFSMSSSISFALPPAKQDSSDYWSMVTYNQQSFPYNTVSEGPHQGTAHYGMNSFSSANIEVGYFTTDGNYVSIPQQHSNADGGTSSSISFATPMDLNSSDINNTTPYYEEGGGSSGNFANWNISFQNAKASSSTNISSVYQSPIFGME